MKYVLYILIKVQYPSCDIDQIRECNAIINDAMTEYCHWGVEYDLTDDISRADLVINPSYDFFLNPEILGFTVSNIHSNPKLYGIPIIRLNHKLLPVPTRLVLKHELFHFFGGGHSDDINSIMYKDYIGNTNFTKEDTLILNTLINF